MNQRTISGVSGKKMSITFKMALICGTVVFIFLTLSNIFFLKLESGLIDSIINDNEKITENNIDAEGLVQKEALQERLQTTSEICAVISAPFLYNLDEKPLVTTLKPYMQVSEISAVEIRDYKDTPFFAYWKAPDPVPGKELPGNLGLNESLSSTFDIVYREEKLGTAKVYMTDQILQQRLEKNKDESKKLVAEFRNQTGSKLRHVMVIQAVVVIVVLATLLLSLILSLKIIAVKPLKQMIDRVKDMAQGEGDLTVRLGVKSKDEMSELAGWLNLFVANLQEMVRQIAGNSSSLNQASDDLSQLSRQMTDDAEGMSEKSNMVAAAGVEMSANMETVAAAVEEVTVSMNMVASSAEEMTSTIDEIAKNSETARSVTGDAVERAKVTSVKVNNLGEAAQKIGKVTEVITEISEQTNLLALNATIEAARAGDAGKGFAVVANEIKALAMQTAQATREIKENISGIQESTTGTMTEIEQILDIINHVNEIVGSIATAVEEQSATTKEISNNVNQASIGLNEVNSNVAQSSQVSSGISKDIADVNQAACNITGSSNQIDQQANTLNQLSSKLKQLVQQFKV